MGPTVEKAYWLTEKLDAYCHTLLIARSLGKVEFFSKLVDDVLDKMKSLVAGNTAVEAYVNSDEARGV